MGRGNRPDQNGANEYQEPTPAAEPAYRYAGDAQSASNRAISESDSMARDIKEGRLSGFVGHGTTLPCEQIHAMLRRGHSSDRYSHAGTLIIGTNCQVVPTWLPRDIMDRQRYVMPLEISLTTAQDGQHQSPLAMSRAIGGSAVFNAPRNSGKSAPRWVTKKNPHSNVNAGTR